MGHEGNGAMDELGGAQVGDARLGRRLIKRVERLGDAPSASIPGACNGRTETQAAYRFFDRARADKRALGWESVPAPHRVRTEARRAAHPVVLCLRDTSERDFNGQAIDGLGRLSHEAQRARPERQTRTARIVEWPDGQSGLMSVSCLIARESGARTGEKAHRMAFADPPGLSPLGPGR